MVIGKALSEGETEFDTIVTVRRSNEDPQAFYVVSPCGMCRELICDYGPTTQVLFMDQHDLRKVRARDLLPGKYTREAQVFLD